MCVQRENEPFQQRRNAVVKWCAGLAAIVVVVVVGCTRSQYRTAADDESYSLIASRKSDPLWSVPSRAVEPDARSRMYVGAELDCGPKPQDDAAANQYMDRPYGLMNTRFYDQISTRSNTENPAWLDHLPRNESNQILLTEELAVDLSLLHSRDFQTQFELVYLSALNLSANRFEFDTQWFGGLASDFTATGSDLGNQRLLDVTANNLGFTRDLAGGGQFATNILNSFVFDFGPGNINGASGSIVSSFTQPLLRGAFRHVRLENLTQAERDLLYQVRDYARFRRTFYVDVMTSYLGLLTQVQAIRNTETNVENLLQSLREHELLVTLEMVSQIQVDQIFQQYQNGRLSLLASKQQLAASLDQFKFQLGLPAWVPFEIDESLLQPFELVDPEVIELQDAAQALYQELIQYVPPTIAPKDVLESSFDEYQLLSQRTASQLAEIRSEYEIWNSRLESTDLDELSEDDRLDIEQQQTLAERVGKTLDDLTEKFEARDAYDKTVRRTINQYSANEKAEDRKRMSIPDLLQQTPDPDSLTLEDILPKLQPPSTVRAWDAMQEAVGQELREEIADLFVAQTQIRLFLISIDPEEIREVNAITYAHLNRLDLMNQQGFVMDAFRQVEVAADALESDLSVTGSVALQSDPSRNNAFRLDSSANQYSVGVQFDGPLNRLNERNAYRASQINYQQATRNLVAAKDVVTNDVRSILRQLELSRLNFQIARQQLVAATRQLDQAQIDLRRSTETEANLTLFLLQALQGVLDAKNNLISNWVQYRIQKMNLFASLELLYLDNNGQWTNEAVGLEEIKNFTAIDPEYFPPQWVDYESDDPSQPPNSNEEIVLDSGTESSENLTVAPVPANTKERAQIVVGAGESNLVNGAEELPTNLQNGSVKLASPLKIGP